jgi:hypothetical protein
VVPSASLYRGLLYCCGSSKFINPSCAYRKPRSHISVYTSSRKQRSTFVGRNVHLETTKWQNTLTGLRIDTTVAPDSILNIAQCILATEFLHYLKQELGSPLQTRLPNHLFWIGKIFLLLILRVSFVVLSISIVCRYVHRHQVPFMSWTQPGASDSTRFSTQQS